MKKISIGTSVALMAMTAAVTVSLTYLYAMDRFNSKVADVNERQAMYAKLNEIDQKIRRDAVGELNETAIKDGICAGYVAGLGDENAKYLSAEKYRVYLQGNVEKSIGAGVRTIQDEDGNMEIVEVLPNSAAEAAGMKTGDVIIAIDGKEVIRITYGEALSYLDGAAGSRVTFQVLRTETKEVKHEEKTVQETVTETKEFTVTRAEYEESTVNWKIVNGNVGYLFVRRFSENTVNEVEMAVAEMQSHAVAGIVLDLRNNTGGTVEHMVDAMYQFLPAGNVAQYIDHSGETIVEFTAGSGRLAIPMAVLIDDTTYGAAEVLAANLRDGKAAVLVGATTAGAASRQETIQLSDGSALILTVGHYVDAQGNSLYGQGVEPDRAVGLTALQKQVLLRELLEPAEDAQLQTAITALIEKGAAVQEIPGSTSQLENTPEQEEMASQNEAPSEKE